MAKKIPADELALPATQALASKPTSAQRAPRTPSPRGALDDLTRIEQIFSPGTALLATTLGVSRQTVSAWLKGAGIPEQSAAQLRDLALAADYLAAEGIKLDAMLLARK